MMLRILAICAAIVVTGFLLGGFMFFKRISQSPLGTGLAGFGAVAFVLFAVVSFGTSSVTIRPGDPRPVPPVGWTECEPARHFHGPPSDHAPRTDVSSAFPYLSPDLRNNATPESVAESRRALPVQEVYAAAPPSARYPSAAPEPKPPAQPSPAFGTSPGVILENESPKIETSRPDWLSNEEGQQLAEGFSIAVASSLEPRKEKAREGLQLAAGKAAADFLLKRLPPGVSLEHVALTPDFVTKHLLRAEYLEESESELLNQTVYRAHALLLFDSQDEAQLLQLARDQIAQSRLRTLISWTGVAFVALTLLWGAARFSPIGGTVPPPATSPS